ncbi:MAG: CHAT domain-containing protein, partial [Spirochaetales bacterium]|nr:CHAT domain-containing protein [Spirochaetales bacterium]
LEKLMSDIQKYKKENKNPILEFNFLYLSGSKNFYQANLEKAAVNFVHALDFIENDKLFALKADCYIHLGVIYKDLCDYPKALEYYNKAIELDSNAKDACLLNIGNVHKHLGNCNKALEYYKKAIAIATQANHLDVLLDCKGALGSVYQHFGRIKEANQVLIEGLALAREQNLIVNIVFFLQYLGGNCMIVYDFDKALMYYEEALQIVKKAELKKSIFHCYTYLMDLYVINGDTENFLRIANEGSALANQFEYKTQVIDFYYTIGKSFSLKGMYDEALKYIEYSNFILEKNKIEDFFLSSIINERLGYIYEQTEMFEEAIKFYKKSLKLNKMSKEFTLFNILYYEIAHVYYKLKNFKKAYAYIKKAIEYSEVIITELATYKYEYMINSARDYSYKYDLLVQICLKQDNFESAYEALENNKSRSLRESLRYCIIHPNVAVINEYGILLNKEQELIEKKHWFYTQLINNKQDISIDIENITLELSNIYEEIRQIDPEYVSLRKGDPVTVQDAFNLVGKQGKDTLLLEYFLTETEVIIFLISSKNKKLQLIRTKIPEKQFNRYIENYNQEVKNYNPHNFNIDEWYRLGDYLISPVEKYMRESDLIYFIPHGVLHNFPLHALLLSGEPIIQWCSVAYAPSLSILKFCQNKGSRKIKSITSYGVAFSENETIDEHIESIFENEAVAVAQLFNGKSYLNKEVTKKCVLDTVSNQDILHFSCHGFYHNINVLESGLKLYDDKFTVEDIFNLQLNCELVTLSACESGINQAKTGDELLGLIRSFLYAGTPSIVASLWIVNSTSTYEFMKEFYSQLQNGVDKAQALRQAQLFLRKKYEHPYFWAPFILIGDWHIQK